MMRRLGPGVVSIVMMGCGPSTGEPSLADPLLYEVLAEHCGSTEAIQLLSLAPNETIEAVYSRFFPSPSTLSVERYGDRWLFVVLAYDREVTRTTFYDLEAEPPEVVSSRIVSVDGCGGDARVLVEQSGTISSVNAPTAAEPWSACGNGLTVFDPDREGSGRSYPELQCGFDVVDDAFLTYTEMDGMRYLVRARLPLDEPAEITVLTPMLFATQPGKDAESRLVTGFEDYRRDLVEVHVPTGQSTVLRTDIEYFSSSDDGRFVVWQSEGSDDSYLWDRHTNEERRLGLPEWEQIEAGPWIRGSAVAVEPEGGSPNVTQLTLLPSAEEIVLEGSWRGEGRIDGTHVLRRIEDEQVASLAILEPGSQLPRPIPHGGLQSSWIRDQSLWVLGTISDADPSSFGLLELAAPDFSPEVIGTGTWYPMLLADGRLLTVLDRDPQDRYGTLVLVDVDGPVTDIDRDVLAIGSTEPLVDDMVVYAVRDRDHERTGVWIAQIAPLPEP